MPDQKNEKNRTYLLLIAASVLAAFNFLFEGYTLLQSRLQSGQGSARQGISGFSGTGKALQQSAPGNSGTVWANPHLTAAVFCLLLCAACIFALLYLKRKYGCKINHK